MTYRKIDPNQIYHIYNRGTLSINIFRDKKDYEKFILKLKEYCLNYHIEIIAFCIMPNHFHLLLKEPEDFYLEKRNSNISLLMQKLIISYTKHYMYKYQHSGVVFQGKYKSKIVNIDNYFSHLINYILDNPVRKKLIKNREIWPYSFKNNDYTNQLTNNYI